MDLPRIMILGKVECSVRRVKTAFTISESAMKACIFSI